MITPFMFGTGIENSYPTIDNGRMAPSEKGASWVKRQQDMMRDRRQVGTPAEPRIA